MKENHVHLLTVCSQFYTDRYTQSLESMMVEAYIYGKFSLVIRLTTCGFHVKYHCLISKNMSLSVLHISLYSYCCLQRL